MEFLTFTNALLELQMIGLGLMLIFRKSGNRLANKLLGAHTITMALVLLPGVLLYMGQLANFTVFVNLDHCLGFALPPLLYLYAESVIQGKISYPRWRFLHFIPAIISSLYFSTFHFLPQESQLQYINQLNQSVNGKEGHIAIYIYFFHSLTYLFFIFRSIIRYNQKGYEKGHLIFTQKINLKWLVVYSLFSLLSTAMITVLTFLGNTPEKFSLLVVFSALPYYYFIILLFEYPDKIHFDQAYVTELYSLGRQMSKKTSETTEMGKTFNLENLNHGLSDKISPREFDVLELMISGYNNTEIAEKLFVSVNTIKKHTGAIYTKLDAKNRTEVTNIVVSNFLN